MGIIVNEGRRNGPNPLFHRIFIVSGAIKLLKMFTCLVVHSSSQEVVVRLRLIVAQTRPKKSSPFELLWSLSVNK